MLNLNGYASGPVAEEDLTLEDRWILSRLTTVTAQVTKALEAYHYADAARTLYDFAWEEFCSFYIEMVKSRLSDDAPHGTRTAAQHVLAHSLDTLLRLLHPMIPFITEEIWRLLARVAPRRGFGATESAKESIMLASWPQPELERRDEQIEQRFATFQEVLGALREIRSRQNIAPRKPIDFSVRCAQSTVDLLQPMTPYFESMANAKGTAFGTNVEPPTTGAHVNREEMEIYVDLTGLIDVAAERARVEKELEKTRKLLQGKEKKLANANFVDRAPADIVQRERDSLTQLKDQASSLSAALEGLEPIA